MRKLFSIFTFYKYVLTNNPKKYEMALNRNSRMSIILAPIFLYPLASMAYYLFSNLWYVYALSMILVLVNMLLFSKVYFKAQDIYRKNKMEEEAKREEKRREDERRQQEIHERMWRDYIEHLRQEQIRIAKEKWENEQRHKQYYQRQQSNNSIDRNMANAMKLLGLKDGFTEKDVKSSYRRLSKIHHPDVGGTEENFKRLNKAYKYVMDRI